MAVARVQVRAGQHGDGLLEPSALLLGEGGVEHFGFGKMTEDALQLERRRCRDAGGECGEFGE